MAVIKADDIVDLVAGTLKDLGRLSFQQIAQNLQDYEVFSKWFKKDKLQFDSGIGIQRTLMTSLSNQASHVGLFDEDNLTVPDLIKQMSVPWVHAKTGWAFEYREVLMNRGKSLIFNVLKPRRADAMISLVEELESKAWGDVPASTDTKQPYGIQYWVVTNATTGFNGGAPSGHTTVGGINPTSVPSWKNYTGQYTNVTKADLIKKMRTAARKCNFKSPISIDDYRNGKGQRYRLYCNEDTLSSFEDVGESQNENLGRDIASMDNTIVFRNFPIIWVPQLDSKTTDPLYGIDHSTFYPVCLKGDYLRESKPRQNANQHNTYEVFVDLTYQYVCVDRRRNFVFYV